MKNKQLYINIISNGLSFLVQFCINFYLTPYLVNNLGSETYGFIPLVNNLIAYANIFSIALNSMTARFVSIEYNTRHYKEANIYFNSVLFADTILSIFLFCIGLVILLNLNYIFNIPLGLLFDVQLTFAFSFLSFFVSLLFSTFGCCYYVKNRLDISAKRNIQSNSIRAIVLLLAFSLLNPHIYYITFTSLLVTIFVSLCDIFYTRKLLSEIILSIRNVSSHNIKIVLLSSVWNAITQLSSTLLSSVDLFLANIFLGATLSGQYSLVKTVPNFIIQLVVIILASFMPQFYSLYAEKKHFELKSSVINSINFVGIFVSLPIGFLLVFGGSFFRLWVSSQNSSFLFSLSSVILLPIMVMCSTQSIVKIYTVTNKLLVPAVFYIISGICNVIISICLIRFTDLGIWALVVSYCCSNLFIDLFFNPIYGAKCLNVKPIFLYKYIFRNLLYVLIMFAISFIFKFIFLCDNWFSLFACSACCSICSIIIDSLISSDTRNVIKSFLMKFIVKS